MFIMFCSSIYDGNHEKVTRNSIKNALAKAKAETVLESDPILVFLAHK